MPVSIKAEQDRFTWKLQDDKPVAPVFRIGNGLWMQCPLCSCIHHTLSRKEGEYTPRCLVREWNTATYQAWIAKYPDAPKHRTVQLVARTVFEAMPYTTDVNAPPIVAAAPVKQKRQRRKAA